MDIKIDHPHMFKEKIQTGINLFTGAGFSKLPDLEGNSLPDAQDLCQEICLTFGVNTSFASDLERLANIVNIRAKQQLQEYLREKYTVNSYNPLYDALNLISINSYITTNIDNIIQCIMDHSDRYNLHDVVVYGACKRNKSTIPYISLHGNVKDINSHLYFGKNELANVDIDNRELFNMMHAKLLEAPTLFWGYGFHDNAVERVIVKILEDQNQGIWVQCMPGSDNIEYFRELGCNVIEGTTQQLLQWIQENILSDEKGPESDSSLATLRQYMIPSRNQLETVSWQDYYVNGRTHWYCILSNYACETHNVDLIYEASLSQKNVVAVGISFSGKTTMLMQLACKMIGDIKLYLPSITVQEAKRIVNSLKGRNAIIYIDNCCDDAYVLSLFMKTSNIRVIGFTNDYIFESAKHLLDGLCYKRIDVGELDLEEAQKIFEKIPPAVRCDSFTYKKNEEEKFSMIELLGQNVKNVLSANRVQTILEKIKKSSKECFEVIALTTYLVTNRSVLSMDVLCAYFETTDFCKIKSILDTAKGYLAEVDVELLHDSDDQDYYNIRSGLFAYHANKILQDRYKVDFCEVIRKFITNVSPYKIYRHYVFKRSAYDAKTFKHLFSDNAHDLYDIIIAFDGSAYSLQQRALYKAYLGDYPGAFADIDRAINLHPNNFSIKNSRAIILFEANKGKSGELAESGMSEAMDTLCRCYFNDKRKVYHAQKFAEFAVYLAKERKNCAYLSQAKEWLNDIITSDESTSYRTKCWLQEVNNLL